MINKEMFEVLNNQNWPEIILRLKAYAIRKVQRRRWRKGRESLPKGHEAADLANKAIEQVWLEERIWNRERQADLLKFLMDAVDSLVSNLVRCAEHRRTDKSPIEEIHEKNHPASANPLYDCDNEIDIPKLLDAIHECAKGEDELEIVFLCLKEGKRPREIAEEYGLEPTEVYQLIRKLKRRVKGAGIKLEQFTLEAL